MKRENITFIDSLGPKTNMSGPQAPPDPKHKTRSVLLNPENVALSGIYDVTRDQK